MELLYLYIHDYSIFKNAQINFTGRYNFNYDNNKNELSLAENKDAIEGDFFSIEKDQNGAVENITAIMGNNGSGKTSILEFLYIIRLRAELEYIIVWKKGGRYKFKAFLLPEIISEEDYLEIERTSKTNAAKWPLLLSEREGVVGCYRKDEQKHVYKLHRSSKSINGLRSLLSHRMPSLCIPKFVNSGIIFEMDNYVDMAFNIIYISNHYTPLHNIEDMNGVIDISTTGLMNSDVRKAYNDTKKENVANPIATHSMMEMIRNAELVAAVTSIKPKLEWSLPNPNGAVVRILSEDLHYLIKEIESERTNFGELGDLILKVCTTKQEEGEKDQPQEKWNKKLEPFIISLFKAFLGNYFRYELGQNIDLKNQGEICKECIKALVEELTIQNIKTFCVSMSAQIKTNQIEYNPSTWKRESRKKDPFGDFAKLMDLLIAHADRFFFGNSYFYDFRRDGQLQDFLEILKLYFRIKTITNFLQFSWEPRISSGEMAQFNLYSRLFHLLNNGSNLKNDILIFMDEIETTIHPSLQRKLISNLIEFFNKFFKEHRVHILFASHSPILLSDIPKSQTILLKKGKGETEVVTDKNETFGANIHTLYQESFFLNDGLTGQFAKDKIKTIVQKIRNEKEGKPDVLEKIEREIANIGEPFMKRKIEELFEEKFASYTRKKYLEKRIKEHEIQIEELRQELKND